MMNAPFENSENNFYSQFDCKMTWIEHVYQLIHHRKQMQDFVELLPDDQRDGVLQLLETKRVALLVELHKLPDNIW